MIGPLYIAGTIAAGSVMNGRIPRETLPSHGEIMQKPRQRQVWSARILVAATFAFLPILTSCDGNMPSPVEPASEVKAPVSAQFGDRCILINGQLYCY
jgi:hypothetical protein